MTIAELERRRRKLSRSYALLARERQLAHESGSGGIQRRRRDFSHWLQRQFLSHYFSAAPRWRLFIRKFGGPRVLPDFCIIGPSSSSIHTWTDPSQKRYVPSWKK